MSAIPASDCYNKNIVYVKWLEALIIVSFSLEVELEINQIADHGGSCMKIMSKSMLFSKMISKRRQFWWTFCEKIFKDFKFIVCYHPQLGKLIYISLCKAPDTS